MPQHRITLSIVLAGLLTLGLGSTAHAGETDATAEGGAQARISDQQLEQFSLALTDLRQIRMEYMPQLKDATSQEERQQLQQAGQQEMIAAIRDRGLEIEEYNRIGKRLGNEKELRERLKDMMQPSDS